MSDLRERLAALEHEQWMAWSQALATGPDGELLSTERLRRWSNLWLPYDELTDEQKDADRVWADKVLVLIERYQAALWHLATRRHAATAACAGCRSVSELVRELA